MKQRCRVASAVFKRVVKPIGQKNTRNTLIGGLKCRMKSLAGGHLLRTRQWSNTAVKNALIEDEAAVKHSGPKHTY
jgi:hypothetical protein